VSRGIHEPENLPTTLLHGNSSKGGNMESVKGVSLITSEGSGFFVFNGI
jgi:hypothetical protein